MYLNDLANYIKNNKKFISGLAAYVQNVQFDITTYAYDPQDRTFYLMASDDDDPIAVKDILRESYRYPDQTKLAIICEEFKCIAPVRSFSTQFGDPNFGDPNLVIIHT